MMSVSSNVSLEAVRAEIQRADEEWAAAASAAQDLDRILSFWSEDATVFPPGAPAISGKTAIREFVANSLRTPGFSITWKTTQITVSPSGDFAYCTGPNRFTFQSPDGGVVTSYGKAVTVWRKDPAGWKCVVDIWNDDPAAAAQGWS
jgi:ketosteroid isomerase-like protein